MGDIDHLYKKGRHWWPFLFAKTYLSVAYGRQLSYLRRAIDGAFLVSLAYVGEVADRSLTER